MRGKKAERKKDINKERKEHLKGDDEGREEGTRKKAVHVTCDRKE